MKKRVCITLSSLVMIIVVWWIVNLNSLLFVSSFLFVTDKNKMNWIGLTGIIAIAGLIYNLYDGRRRFRGDIRSKSRIDWMKTLRPLIANYVTDISNYMYFYYLLKTEKDETRKQRLNEVLTERMRLIRSEYYQINLYVPKNDSNKLILDNVDLLYGELHNIGPYYDYGLMHSKIGSVEQTNYGIVVDEYISNLINKTVKDSSEYFKKEWEKAKQGD